MINKKIHADMIKRRQEQQPEPDVQKKLRTALQALGDKIIPLENHAWEFGLTVGVRPENALEVFRRLKDEPEFQLNFLVDVTAVDFLDQRETRFEVVYHLLSLSHLHRLCVKIQVGEETPEVDSVVSLWPTANFLEREVFDMYGIRFRGHGDLRRILLYDEFVGHPLRKDYPLRGKQPRVPLRVPELRNTADDMRREELVALPVRQRMKQNSEIAGS